MWAVRSDDQRGLMIDILLSKRGRFSKERGRWDRVEEVGIQVPLVVGRCFDLL